MYLKRKHLNEFDTVSYFSQTFSSQYYDIVSSHDAPVTKSLGVYEKRHAEQFYVAH